jgi:hypothetical protein
MKFNFESIRVLVFAGGFMFALTQTAQAQSKAPAAPPGLIVATGSGPMIAVAAGTVRDNLPKPPIEATAKIIYPKPGEIKITGSRICGDGDVEDFAHSHPGFEILSSSVPKVGVVAGMWVNNGSIMQFFPVAKGSINVKNDSTTTLVSLASGKDEPIGASFANGVKNISALKGYVLDGATPLTASVSVAAQICKVEHLGLDKDGVQKDKASAPPKLSIAVQFSTVVRSAISTAVTTAVAAERPSDAAKFDIALSPIALKFVPGGKLDALGDPLFQLGQRVLALRYPCSTAPCPDLATYVAGVNALPEVTDIKSIYAVLHGGGKTCAQVPNVKQPVGNMFWWEPIPLQLTCDTLAGAGTFKTLAVALVKPASAPSEADFRALRNGMATLLLKAGMIQHAQNSFAAANVALANRDSCVPPTGPYIDRIMGSLTAGASLKTGFVQKFTTHAEGDFAIDSYKRYYGANGDYNAVFGMGGEVEPLFNVIQGKGPDFNSFSTIQGGSVLFNFLIRALGCCGSDPCFC